MIRTCLIIGAGMAGLMAAQLLQKQGVAVTVLDKGRGVGGRMGTRRVTFAGKTAVFDHGAQFFTVRREPFRHYVEEWLAAGVIVEWTRGFESQDGHPRYRGVQGMTAIAKHLASTLDVRRQQRVTAITKTAVGWQATTANGEQFVAEAMIMTPPVPQSRALLQAGDVALSSDVENALDYIRYAPCFAVLALLAGASGVPAPGGVQQLAEPLAWIGDNRQKGLMGETVDFAKVDDSGETAVTIHAGPQFSETYFERDRDEVAQLVLEAAQPWLNEQPVLTYQVQRWRYSMPTQLHPERCLAVMGDYPLIFAGDAFLEARVEGAAMSGLAAAERLLAMG